MAHVDRRPRTFQEQSARHSQKTTDYYKGWWGLWDSMLLGSLVLSAVLGHAPQFAKTRRVRLKHANDVSQAVYFKGSGSLLVMDPKAGKVVQVSFTRNHPVGDLFVGCDGTETAVELVSATGTSEPFTQTMYYTKYDSKFPTCVSSFTVRGVFEEPWAVVVGKKEQFSAWELLAFPVFSAKLHGSWWNENYVYHWWFIVALACSCLGLRTFTAALFFASAADRLTHAWTPIVLVDILPGVFILLEQTSFAGCVRWGWRAMTALAVFSVLAFGWLHVMNWFVAAALVAGFWVPAFGNSLACFFVFGSGYFIAPLALLLLQFTNHSLGWR